MAGGWSSLQRDLLGLILEKLDLADHARFASVCSSWRSAAVENRPINKPLYFALSRHPKHLVRRFITSIIPAWSKARFIGAGLDGWVVILIDGRKLFLLNKGFNSIIPLPPPPNYTHNFFGRAEYCKTVLSSPPSSSGECTVVLRLSAGHHLFYCRLPSDKSFKNLLDIHQDWSEDIVFYKGRLYVLCYPNTIVIFDHLLNKVSRSRLVTYLADAPYPWRFFISGNNELSIVAGSGPSQYSAFTLEGSEPRLVPLNNVGEDNQILLSNYYCSLSITTKEHKEFRRGTSYFENDSRTFVLDTSKDPNVAKADDPRPLFFVMFSSHGIMK